MHSFWQDVRYGVRVLAKNPGFALVAVLTIALGIGGNTAIFSIVDAVLLRPLPYQDSDRLVGLTNSDTERGLTGIAVSFMKLERLQNNSKTLAAVGGFFLSSVSLKTEGLPEEVIAIRGTGNFLDVLGAPIARGRNFLPSEDVQGGADVAVITDRLWRNRFGADPTLVGRAVNLDSRSVTIVGILSPSFKFPFQQPEPDVWLPRVFENPGLGIEKIRSGAGYMQVYARMKPDATLKGVQAEIHTIDAAYRADFPHNADSSEDLIAAPLKENLVSGVRQSLWVLFAAVAFVLVIGCANLMNLLLARASARAKEIAIRMAIGASRARLVRQMLTESILLSLLGGVLGILLAFATKWFIQLLPPGTIPRSDEIVLNGRVLAFCILLTVASGIAFGLLPALRASRESLRETLNESSRGASASRRTGRSRSVLIGAEVCLAVLLLTGAGVLIRSLGKLMQVDPGFDPGHVLTFSISLPPQTYPKLEQQRHFYERLVEELQSNPQIKFAAVVNALPLSGTTPYFYLCPQGLNCKGLGKDPLSALLEVTPQYFKTMSIPVLKGREFNAQDITDGHLVAIINETSAQKFFGGDAVGKWVANSRYMTHLEVIGVVKDVHFNGLNAAAFPELYLPETQSSFMLANMSVVIRSNSAYRPLVDAAKAAVAKIDPDIPVSNVATMDEALSASLAQSRLTTGLSAGFALLALCLTMIGIYGVVAYTVTQRTQEIGIRMALGATPGDVVRLLMGQGMRVVGIGLAAGVIASLALTRLLESLLFGTNPRDPLTLTLVSVMILSIAALACYLPARRAAKFNPTLALVQQ